jgi:hypothetical protein
LSSTAQEVIDDQHFQCFIVAFGNELIHLCLIQAAHQLHKFEKNAAAVAQVLCGRVLLLGTHGLDIKSHELAVLAIVVFFEDAYLIKCAAKVDGTKASVFIEFQAVLIVEMDGIEFLECQRKAHLI